MNQSSQVNVRSTPARRNTTWYAAGMKRRRLKARRPLSGTVLSHALRAEGWSRREAYSLIESTLIRKRCNLSDTARALGITRMALWRWLRDFPALGAMYRRVALSIGASESLQTPAITYGHSDTDAAE